jgi:flagellar L-ring protein precursor FlgH
MRRIFFAAAALAVQGCSLAPEVQVHQPTTARAPQPVLVAQPRNGAIFQTAGYRPLFEDRRARFVGDTLTVVIHENISSAQKNATSINRTSSIAVDVPTVNIPLVNNVPVVKGYLNRLPGTTIDASSANKMDGKGETSASNAFTGTITVTVIEVLVNGNLLVSGEKVIGTNRELERVRFSGVVNPATIVAGNQVSSAQIADARMEYRGDGAADSAQMMSWLSRFFLSFLPF